MDGLYKKVDKSQLLLRSLSLFAHIYLFSVLLICIGFCSLGLDAVSEKSNYVIDLFGLFQGLDCALICDGLDPFERL